jgi:hypothetical protein
MTRIQDTNCKLTEKLNKTSRINNQGEMEKIILTEIDKENWQYVLYETFDKNWICDIVYSPLSFVDLSMLIQLDNDQKSKIHLDRNYLLELTTKIRDNYKDYLSTALDRNRFEFK